MSSLDVFLRVCRGVCVCVCVCVQMEYFHLLNITLRLHCNIWRLRSFFVLIVREVLSLQNGRNISVANWEPRWANQSAESSNWEWNWTLVDVEKREDADKLKKNRVEQQQNRQLAVVFVDIFECVCVDSGSHRWKLTAAVNDNSRGFDLCGYPANLPVLHHCC